MKRWFLSTAALFLALPLTAARPAAAPAPEPKTIAQAVGDEDPWIVSWIDGPNGTTEISDDNAELVADLFAGVQYFLNDNGRLLLGHLKGTDLNLIVPPAAQVDYNDKTYFVVHGRDKDRTVLLDGRIWRSKEDPTKGYAEFTLLLVGADGYSFSSHIEQDLTFKKDDILSKPSG